MTLLGNNLYHDDNVVSYVKGKENENDVDGLMVIPTDVLTIFSVPTCPLFDMKGFPVEITAKPSTYRFTFCIVVSKISDGHFIFNWQVSQFINVEANVYNS